ncbi:MAG: GNAT family N-acetyltransferase, partial [Microbacterium sp.]
LGAKQDGVMRAMSRYRNGALRDSVEYSVIEPEWPAVEANLEARLAKRR